MLSLKLQSREELNQVVKNALTKYTSTSWFVIVYQIHDILGKCLKKERKKRKQGRTKIRVCSFYVHSIKSIKILAYAMDRFHTTYNALRTDRQTMDRQLD